VFPIVIHPDFRRQAACADELERLLDHMLSHSGVRMVTLGEMAADFRRRVPFGSASTVGGANGLLAS